MVTRQYEQRARAEESERTRMRIIDAVFERLRDAPAEPVAVDRIATMAGVARSTVYRALQRARQDSAASAPDAA